MLPGTQCDHRLWQELKKELGADFNLVHWPIPQQELSDVVKALHQSLMEGEKLDAVVGFSLGGYLLANYLHSYRGRHVRSIPYFIVSNTAAALPNYELEQRRRIISQLKPDRYMGANQSRIRQLLAGDNADNLPLIELIQGMDKSLGAASLKHQLSFTGERADCQSGINLAASETKIHFINTEKDPLINYDWLKGLSSNVHQYQIKGEGHMLPLEHPRQLSKLLKETLL